MRSSENAATNRAEKKIPAIAAALGVFDLDWTDLSFSIVSPQHFGSKLKHNVYRARLALRAEFEPAFLEHFQHRNIVR